MSLSLGSTPVTPAMVTKLDTTDATATAEDILSGKTAYADGQKLTGTLVAGNVDYSLWSSSLSNMENILSYALTKIPSVDLDLSQRISLAYMFNNLHNIEEIDVSNFNTSNVRSLEGMFYQCQKLKNIDLSSWVITNLTNIGSMFSGCMSVEEIKLGNNIDFSKLTSAAGVFTHCTNLKKVDFENFNFSNKIIGVSNFLNTCVKLKNVDLSNCDFSKVTSYQNFFAWTQRFYTTLSTRYMGFNFIIEFGC